MLKIMMRHMNKEQILGAETSFREARRFAQNCLNYDHERMDHPAKRAPRGIGYQHSVEDGDFTYWIERE